MCLEKLNCNWADYRYGLYQVSRFYHRLYPWEQSALDPTKIQVYLDCDPTHGQTANSSSYCIRPSHLHDIRHVTDPLSPMDIYMHLESKPSKTGLRGHPTSAVDSSSENPDAPGCRATCCAKCGVLT
jgi:hypothetical protein